MNELHEAFADSGLTTLVVISGMPSGSPATAAYCQSVRDKYQLGDMAVCDPEDKLLEYGKNALTMLVDVHGHIVYKGVGTSIESLEVKIGKVLGGK